MGYRDVFKDKHTFLAVIHADSLEQTLRNVEIAFKHGADGIFLINHEGLVSDLFNLYDHVRAQYPHEWIGLNCLGMRSWYVFGSIPASVSGVWSDDAGIREGTVFPAGLASISWEMRQERTLWHGLYFGGVAFKYQQMVSDPGYVARLAAPYMDVVTTSGEETGLPPSVQKIKKMRSALGPDVPLAIASGMTPENVTEYMGCADCFLVATGISSSFTELDPVRTAQFAKVLGKKSRK